MTWSEMSQLGAAEQGLALFHTVVDMGNYAAITSIQCRDWHIAISCETQEPLRFLAKTFNPDGAFGVRLGVPVTGQAVLTIRDRCLSQQDLSDFARRVARHATHSGVYCPVPEFGQTKWMIGPVEVFSDVAPGSAPETAQNLILKLEREFVVVSVDSKMQRRWLARIVRQIANAQLSWAVQTGFHASSFEYRGRVYLVVGDSGSGKSTFALGAALRLGAAWLGNDRAHVHLADGQCESYPGALAVNKGTLYALGLERAYETWRLEAPVPDHTTDWTAYDGASKLNLSPSEVQQWLGVRLSAGGKLGGLVFPRVRHDQAPSLVKRIDAAEMEDVLRQNCLYLNHKHIQEDYLALGDASYGAQRHFERFLEMARALPAWRVEVSEYKHTGEVLAAFQAAA